MGTTWSVTLTALPEDASRQSLQDGVETVLTRINGQMSTYLPASDLSRLNQAPGGEWVAVPPDLIAVMQEAGRINRLSGGAFDVTVGPLVNLWGFGPQVKEPQVPIAEALQAARKTVGFEHLRLRREPPAVWKEHDQVYVDLSAIAKGYAVDDVADYLIAQGVSDYLIEIGGEVRAKGLNPEGQPWRIGIEKPNPGQREVQTILALDDMALASSGDYRNYFELEGRRYSHTIDPRTARPVEHGLASVSVLHTSCMTADALATALLVLGPERGFTLAESNDIAALFILPAQDGYTERATTALSAYRSVQDN